MRIVIAGSQVSLADPCVFTSLDASVTGLDTGAASISTEVSSLLAAGIDVFTAADHVFVSREGFISAAGELIEDPAWITGLGDMLSYAASKGWTDDRGWVQAHRV